MKPDRSQCPARRAKASAIRRRHPCPPLLDDRPKRAVLCFYADVLTGRDAELLEDLLMPDFTAYDSAGAVMDRVGYIAAIQMLHEGFGELTVTVEDQIAERDRVTTRWTAIGRHTGRFAGIAPTGREVLMAGTDIHRLEGRRLAELWEQVDFASLIEQLL